MAMSNIWNKIHRIKDNGWTWEQFLSAIDQQFPSGIDEKTLYQHHRRPDMKTSRHVADIINTIHKQRFPSPFPEDIDALLNLYNIIWQQQNDEAISLIETFLNGQIEQENPGLRLARLYWLKGNIDFDRIASLRDNGKQAQLLLARNAAINAYQNALKLIDDSEINIMGFVRYKLQQNILASYLNAVYEEKRSKDRDVLNFLQNSSYIQDSKELLAEEPFNWLVARNGLRFSSMRQNADDCEFFFRAMVKSSKHFLDPAFAPVNHAPIAEGENYQWAIEHVITPIINNKSL